MIKPSQVQLWTYVRCTVIPEWEPLLSFLVVSGTTGVYGPAPPLLSLKTANISLLYPSHCICPPRYSPPLPLNDIVLWGCVVLLCSVRSVKNSTLSCCLQELRKRYSFNWSVIEHARNIYFFLKRGAFQFVFLTDRWFEERMGCCSGRCMLIFICTLQLVSLSQHLSQTHTKSYYKVNCQPMYSITIFVSIIFPRSLSLYGVYSLNLNTVLVVINYVVALIIGDKQLISCNHKQEY